MGCSSFLKKHVWFYLAFKEFFCYVWKAKEESYSLILRYRSRVIAYSRALCFLAFSECGATELPFHHSDPPLFLSPVNLIKASCKAAIDCFHTARACPERRSDGQMYLVKGQTNSKGFQVKQRPVNKFLLGSEEVTTGCVKGSALNGSVKSVSPGGSLTFLALCLSFLV